MTPQQYVAILADTAAMRTRYLQFNSGLPVSSLADSLLHKLYMQLGRKFQDLIDEAATVLEEPKAPSLRVAETMINRILRAMAYVMDNPKEAETSLQRLPCGNDPAEVESILGIPCAGNN